MNKVQSLVAVIMCCSLQLSAQITFTALKLTPELPQQNRRVTFEYNQSYSPLIRLPKVEILVFQLSDNGVKVMEPAITKKGTVLSGSLVVDSNANCIAFAFSAGEEKDLNKGNGYILPVYTPGNSPVRGYYRSVATLYKGYGEDLFALPSNHEKELANLEEGLKQYPALKTEPLYFSSYIDAISSTKKKEAPPLVEASLKEFQRQGNLTEEGYAALASAYRKLRQKEKADSLTAFMKERFPGGFTKKNELVDSFFEEKDMTKRVTIYNNFVNRYTTAADKEMVGMLRSRLAMGYAKEKDYLSFETWSKDLSKESLYSIHNDLAWSMAENGENLEQAKKYSFAAAMYAKNEMLKPTKARPVDLSTKQWLDRRKGTYGMYADTYAFILYKLGDYKAGLPYAKEAAAIYKLDAEYNERYALLVEKAMPLKEGRLTLEKMVKAGIASSKTKDVLKNLYIKEELTGNGFDQYLARLEADAKIKRREEIAKTIISEPAPGFALKDMEGKVVNLSDLKGKILVIDFWATWCGPCIASMPAMNKALTKFKDNDNVRFLFVDTWESAGDKVQNAKDFMTKKNYPFHVLMDNENEMVSDFSVRGIPTKFIIDKTGKIRFKAIGFGGNDDDLVEELTTMIELASK